MVSACTGRMGRDPDQASSKEIVYYYITYIINKKPANVDLQVESNYKCFCDEFGTNAGRIHCLKSILLQRDNMD